MSDAPQGPDWWLASDGRWYPPQNPPTQIPPPPGAPGLGGTPARPRNNALAIASLVLGILWVCGLGSLLALILGIVALSQIKKSGASGRGLAIAGIVLGVLGILATAGTAIGIALAADNVKFNEPDERNDVEIVRCGIKETETSPSVDLRITNDSSRRSNYFMIVDITGSGSKDFNVGLSTLGPVEPDETKLFTVNASTTATSLDGPFNCAVNTVNRIAAE